MTGKDGSKRQQHLKVPKHHVLVEHTLALKTGFLPRQVINSIISTRLEEITASGKIQLSYLQHSLKQNHLKFKLGKKRRKQDQKFPKPVSWNLFLVIPQWSGNVNISFLKYFVWVKNDFPNSFPSSIFKVDLCFKLKRQNPQIFKKHLPLSIIEFIIILFNLTNWAEDF